MDVQILYKFRGGSEHDITQYVISYNREKRICTGIATLQVVTTLEFWNSKDPKPWDRITLYEGGHKKGEFYVGEWSPGIPDATINLFAQDNSKRLQDYFIAESYIVDYPSTARYWIELFLNAAGVSYTFTTDSTGSLLSNNTSLGLQSAYDQIINLLQISGWYLYFDNDSVAVIGELNKDINTIALTLNKHDITSMKVTKDDKMLRNRALVWGSGDPATGGWIFADLQTTTPWNYDANDVRTAVLASSSIPSYYAAYTVAEQMLTEFARITVQKEIETWGEQDVDLGDFVKVHSTLFNGIGLLTTLGSEMTREGLKTFLILDERCPRLFAYYDFGDYVYLGTAGSGVWRKLMEFGSSWNNYSTGLNDLVITDLYKNRGVLSTVTLSGESYYNSAGIWSPIVIQDLPYSGLFNGEPITGVVSSGIKSRAVTYDRISNDIKLVADTYSGLNYPFYTPYPVEQTAWGLMPASGIQSWLLDVGTGESIVDSWQITLSGETNITVFDVENDGLYDYVSVATSGVDYFTIFYDKGERWGDGYSSNTSTVSFTYQPQNVAELSKSIKYREGHIRGASFIDEYNNRECTFISSKLVSGSYHQFLERLRVSSVATSAPPSSFITDEVDLTGYFTADNPSGSTLDGGVMGIHKDNINTYSIYAMKETVSGTTLTLDFYKTTVDINTANNASSVLSEDLLQSLVFNNVTRAVTHQAASYYVYWRLINNISHIAIFVKQTTSPYSSFIYYYTFDISSGSLTAVDNYELTAVTAPFPVSNLVTGDQNFLDAGAIFQVDAGTTVTLAAVYLKITGAGGFPYKYDYEIRYLSGDPSDMSGLSDTLVSTHTQDRGTVGGLDTQHGAYSLYNQSNGYSFYFAWGTSYIDSSNATQFTYFVGNKYGVTEYLTGPPVTHAGFLLESEEGNLFSTSYTPTISIYEDSIFIARDYNTTGSPWSYIDPDTHEVLGPVTISDSNYTVNRVFPQLDSQDNGIYVHTTYFDGFIFEYRIVKINSSGTVLNYFKVPNAAGSGSEVFNTGNWFVYKNTRNIPATDITIKYYFIDYEVPTSHYYVLVRDEDTFIPIMSGVQAYRLDASSIPVLVAQNQVGTINYIYGHPDNTVSVTSPSIPTDWGIKQLNDMRIINSETVSGIFNRNLAITTIDGLCMSPLDSITFSVMFTSASGTLIPLESTNFKLPGQYVFAEENNSPNFYQKDFDTFAYLPYDTNLPTASGTIIRVDDMI